MTNTTISNLKIKKYPQFQELIISHQLGYNPGFSNKLLEDQFYNLENLIEDMENDYGM